MQDTNTESVPRQPEGPSPQDLLEAMEPCEPYTVNDLTDLFDDVSRWTIQRRLDDLHDQGHVRKKKHTENRVSWWIDAATD